MDFVGHPLVEKLSSTVRAIDRDRARSILGLDPTSELVALLPGSRRNEIAYQLPIQLEAARLLAQSDSSVSFVLATAPSISREDVERMVAQARLPDSLRLDIVRGQTHEAIRACDVALAKPGTVTVEIMLLERPMVVMGRAHPLTAAILRRLVRVPWMAMPNLIAGESIVPELLQEEARPAAIAAELRALFAGEEREVQLARLARATRALGAGGAARNASAIAEEMLASAPA